VVRGNRRVSLTETGQAYVAAVRRIADHLAEAERAATGEYTSVRGNLAITAPLVFGRLRSRLQSLPV